MSSSWDVENPKFESNWDEPSNTINTKNTISNVTTNFQTIQLQLLGVIGVLLIIIVIVLPVTYAISGTKTSTTTCCTDTVTTTVTYTTTSITTTTTDPYVCSNMTTMHNTDLPGNDILPYTPMSFNACCTQCLTTSGCVALTWALTNNYCYRKTSTGSGGVFNINLLSAHF